MTAASAFTASAKASPGLTRPDACSTTTHVASTPSSLRYQDSGVQYDLLDAFKRACQQAAAQTTSELHQHGLSEPANVRGDSAYLLEDAGQFIAHVEEGLGTKNRVADAMDQLAPLAGGSWYHPIGIDTVATIVNDLITCGALPVSVAMHAAVGDSAWFEDRNRAAALAAGFAQGCRQAGAVWGGGETPTLKGLVEPSTIVLAGSAVGLIRPKSRRILGDVHDGDAILFLASSGVQTNGLSLCRTLADRLPKGYLTPMPDGRAYGQALLDPSVIYVKFIAACQQAGLALRYAAHMTGHGWRKLMRLPEPFVHRITAARRPPPIFEFLMKNGPIDLREAFATFNMGVGFAVWVRPDEAERAVNVARALGYDAWIGGVALKQAGRKAVEIVEHGIVFEADTLQLR